MKEYTPYIDEIEIYPDEQTFDLRMMFYDGIAIEVDDNDNIKSDGWVLTYPSMTDVKNHDNLQFEIQMYCGRADFVPYDIALKFGEYHKLPDLLNPQKKEKRKEWISVFQHFNGDFDIIEVDSEELEKYEDVEDFLAKRCNYGIDEITWHIHQSKPTVLYLTPDDFEPNEDWEDEND